MLKLIESKKLNASNLHLVFHYPLSIHIVWDNHIQIIICVMLFDLWPHKIWKDAILFLYVEVLQIFQFEIVGTCSTFVSHILQAYVSKYFLRTIYQDTWRSFYSLCYLIVNDDDDYDDDDDARASSWGRWSHSLCTQRISYVYNWFFLPYIDLPRHGGHNYFTETHALFVLLDTLNRT
jgi:hypothetical protein